MISKNECELTFVEPSLVKQGINDEDNNVVFTC